MDHLLASVQAVLSSTAPRWEQLARGLPADLLARPAAPGQWSALNCLQHLIDTERDFDAFDPDHQGTVAETGRPSAALAAEFAALRAESLALVATLTPADLARGAVHQELGPVTLSQLLHEWAGHDLMHTVQAERALMQPFIQGCGPWQVYFAAHRAVPPAA
jgi:hypothetical protein